MLLPAPSGANKKSSPRGEPMQYLAPRRNPVRSNGHLTVLAADPYCTCSREYGAGSGVPTRNPRRLGPVRWRAVHIFCEDCACAHQICLTVARTHVPLLFCRYSMSAPFCGISSTSPPASATRAPECAAAAAGADDWRGDPRPPASSDASAACAAPSLPAPEGRGDGSSDGEDGGEDAADARLSGRARLFLRNGGDGGGGSSAWRSVEAETPEAGELWVGLVWESGSCMTMSCVSCQRGRRFSLPLCSC